MLRLARKSNSCYGMKTCVRLWIVLGFLYFLGKATGRFTNAVAWFALFLLEPFSDRSGLTLVVHGGLVMRGGDMEMRLRRGIAEPKEKSHSPSTLPESRIRFTRVVGVRVKVVREPLVGGAGDVAVAGDVASSGLCVEFICARGFMGGSLGWAAMGDGPSRRPPPPAFASRCAVCGTGSRTRPWAVSLVSRKIVVRVLVVAAADDVDVLKYCLVSSGVSDVGCVVSRFTEVEFGRQVVVLR
jgi:hypothetical protein